ncbi:MAG: response regulator transcription factor [Xenococcaceae cyanobacterium MO_207.B15]|nr:response regulator transcription factor [Xenococcaceae cyanobacterium MO_207.B15]MDJ0746720.1 response regulator transcription factor [Xenococcaceae cyanobacterium MO_167.B27]
MINVLIVDDQKTVHNILKSYLQRESDLKIVGFAVNGQDAVNKILVLQPDVVLMDLEMPIMDGLAATKIITDRFVKTKVLILTSNDNEHNLNQALQNGAKGYLLKTATAEELINAIKQVQKGYFQLGLELVEKYIYKIVKLEADLDELSQLKEKFEVQSETIEEINNKFAFITTDIEQKVVQHVEATLDKHKAFFIDNHPNIEFKVDGVDYRLKKLEKEVYNISRLQGIWFVIILGLAAFSFLINLYNS